MGAESVVCICLSRKGVAVLQTKVLQYRFSNDVQHDMPDIEI